MDLSPRLLRERARMSQMQIAARSGRSLPTVRLYEANPEAVSVESRADLDPIYAALAPEGSSAEPTPPPRAA